MSTAFSLQSPVSILDCTHPSEYLTAGSLVVRAPHISPPEIYKNEQEQAKDGRLTTHVLCPNGSLHVLVLALIIFSAMTTSHSMILIRVIKNEASPGFDDGRTPWYDQHSLTSMMGIS